MDRVKKGLIHGSAHHIKNARSLHPRKIGCKIKGDSLRRAVQSHSPQGQPDHDEQQPQHHIFDYRLQPLAHSHAAHPDAHDQHRQRPAGHSPRVLEHSVKKCAHSLRRQGRQLA